MAVYWRLAAYLTFGTSDWGFIERGIYLRGRGLSEGGLVRGWGLLDGGLLEAGAY